jgi:trk system potassium uptake protein TrkH
MIPLVDAAPHTLLFWRSFMSWIGGIGFIAFSIALAGSTGLLPSKLFRKESRDEPLMRSIVAVGREIWTIYAMLTFVAVCLILFTGLSLWESVNLGLSAISTGGFCLHQGGISWYNSIFLELILIPIMIAGALPFRLYYAIGRHRRLGFFGDQQVKVFFIALIAGTAVLAYDLTFFSNLETSEAVRQGLFMTVSALTTTGFQISGLHSWASVTILFLALLAFIGGSSGSTAGGIKLSRIVYSLRALLWWFRRHYTSGRVLMSFRVEGKNIARPTAELEAAKNILVIILSAAVIIAGTLAFSMAYDTMYTFTGALFEAVNAFSNTGFFTGQVTPLMPEFSKWILTCLMWIGRLEVIPVVMLAMAVLGRED